MNPEPFRMFLYLSDYVTPESIYDICSHHIFLFPLSGLNRHEKIFETYSNAFKIIC